MCQFVAGNVSRACRWRRQRSRAFCMKARQSLACSLARTRAIHSICLRHFVNGLISVYIQIFTPTFDTCSCPCTLHSTIKYLQNIKMFALFAHFFFVFWFLLATTMDINWTAQLDVCLCSLGGRLIFLQNQIAIRKVNFFLFFISVVLFSNSFVLISFFVYLESIQLWLLQPPPSPLLMLFGKFNCLWERNPCISIALSAFPFALLKRFSWRINLHHFYTDCKLSLKSEQHQFDKA